MLWPQWLVSPYACAENLNQSAVLCGKHQGMQKASISEVHALRARVDFQLSRMRQVVSSQAETHQQSLGIIVLLHQFGK